MHAAAPPSEQQLAELVRVFYARARAHAELGPIFAAHVADWDHHLRLVQDFWSHVLLDTDRYRGTPYRAHLGLPIRREHIGQWLALFETAAAETLPAPFAARAIAHATMVADSFRAGLFPFDPVPGS